MAIIITRMVASMACVWIFTIWSLLPLVWHASEPIVLYVSSGLLQLILLPMIMVGTQLLGKSQERRSVADHSALIEINKEMDQLIESCKKHEDNMIILLAKLEHLESLLIKSSS